MGRGKEEEEENHDNEVFDTYICCKRMLRSAGTHLLRVSDFFLFLGRGGGGGGGAYCLAHIWRLRLLVVVVALREVLKRMGAAPASTSAWSPAGVVSGGNVNERDGVRLWVFLLFGLASMSCAHSSDGGASRVAVGAALWIRAERRRFREEVGKGELEDRGRGDLGGEV